MKVKVEKREEFIGLKVSPSLKARLKKIAEHDQITLSSLVHFILRSFVDCYELPEEV